MPRVECPEWLTQGARVQIVQPIRGREIGQRGEVRGVDVARTGNLSGFHVEWDDAPAHKRRARRHPGTHLKNIQQLEPLPVAGLVWRWPHPEEPPVAKYDGQGRSLNQSSPDHAYAETGAYGFHLSRSGFGAGWSIQALCQGECAGISHALCGIGSIAWGRKRAEKWAEHAVLRWLDPDIYGASEV